MLYSTNSLALVGVEVCWAKRTRGGSGAQIRARGFREVTHEVTFIPDACRRC